MCFPLYQEYILSRDVHAGHEFVVAHNGKGSRCGYVKVEVGHPWHGKDYDDIDGNSAIVHGGLTFAEPGKSYGEGGPDNVWWVGFDCCHGGDSPDPALPGSSRPNLARIFLGDVADGIHVWSQAEVEAECRSLCEQAAAATTQPAHADGWYLYREGEGAWWRAVEVRGGRACGPWTKAGGIPTTVLTGDWLGPTTRQDDDIAEAMGDHIGRLFREPKMEPAP